MAILAVIALQPGAAGVALPGLVNSANADTVSQPQLVADINPAENTVYSSTDWLTTFGETLCFSGDDGFHGMELWCSDGTGAGTALVSDIRPGSGSSEPVWITDVGDTLFFVAGDGEHGYELWRSDGTEAGTALVMDIRPDSSEDFFSRFTAPESLTNVGGALFFTADDGEHGRELWRSDGTEAGTEMVTDIYPGATQSYPGELTNVGGALFFTADDGEHGYELWRSDGTEAGTEMLRDIHPGETSRYPGPANSNPAQLTDVNGTLFFVVTEDPVYGHELWRSDGTEAGTEIVRDIYPGPESGGPAWLTNVGGTLFFTADDPQSGDEELWRSDGTEAGTEMVIGPGWEESTTGRLTDVDGTLFFTAVDPGHGSGLWRSDGTEGGTTPVRDIHPGIGPYPYPDSLTDVGGSLFFVADDGVHGIELWRSDGTEAGTEMVSDIYPWGDSFPFPKYLTALGKTLFFVADDGVHGYDALWMLHTADDPPTALDDEATLREDATATAIDVLANDTDPDGGPKSLEAATAPAHGTVEVIDDGAGLTYEPDPDYCNDRPGDQTDAFEYTLAPGGSSARVAVTVSCADVDPASPPLERTGIGVSPPVVPHPGAFPDAGGSSPRAAGRASPTLLDRRIQVTRRWAAVTLRCAWQLGCRGRLWIFARRSGAETSKPGSVMVQGTYAIPGGRERVVWLRLTAAGRRMHPHRHAVGGKLVIAGAHHRGQRLVAVKLHFARSHR